jgi:hypothetical protein
MDRAGTPGSVRRAMARKTLRAMRGDLDEEADLTGSATLGSRSAATPLSSETNFVSRSIHCKLYVKSLA